MKKSHFIVFLLLFFVACGQNGKPMKTPENAAEKFDVFIAKKKFDAQPYPNYYPGLADEKMQPIFTEKINQIALDFKEVALSNNPTDKKYQEKIAVGLARFSEIYLETDSEDLDRICSYIEEIMDIVALESSDGQLSSFRYGFEPK
ncbi:DUF4844 domain-containing protein [Flavobacterium filum]|nr:DUF4844 domain-containing protein [Flavobacterium filum]